MMVLLPLVTPIPPVLGCHEDAPKPREENANALILCRMEAESRICADVDNFQNWLAMHCANVKPEPTPAYIPATFYSRQMFIESLTIPQLVAMLLYPNREIAGMAAGRLQQAYVAYSADWIENEAGRLMDAGYADGDE